MIITETEYEEYVGDSAPQPFVKWYDKALNDLLAYCPNLDLTLDETKKALMLQIEHKDQQDMLGGVSIGRFRIDKQEKQMYSLDVLNILNSLPCCSRWVERVRGCVCE